MADIVGTCYGERNGKVAEAFVKSGKVGGWKQQMLQPVYCLSFRVLLVCCGCGSLSRCWKQRLNRQKLQGPSTTNEVYEALTRVKATPSGGGGLVQMLSVQVVFLFDFLVVAGIYWIR